MKEAIIALQAAMTEAGLTSLTVTAAERSFTPVAQHQPIHEAIVVALESGPQTAVDLHALVEDGRGVACSPVSVRMGLYSLAQDGRVRKLDKKVRSKGSTPSGRRGGLAFAWMLV